MTKSSIIWFTLNLAAIAAFTVLGPSEKSLGSHVRVVYLHGAWVWTSLAAILSAGLLGLAGLVSRRDGLNRWSRSLGRTGLIFWISYLPISLWAMQANWNGLFLAEPRWRLAVIFAVSGLLLQLGLALIEDPAWASAGNVVYMVAIFLALFNTSNVMHPAAPILNSDSWDIRLFFGGLLLLVLLAAGQVAMGWRRLEGRQDARDRVLE